MSEREIGIEEARGVLGDLVNEAFQGDVVHITRSGRPAVALVSESIGRTYPWPREEHARYAALAVLSVIRPRVDQIIGLQHGSCTVEDIIDDFGRDLRRLLGEDGSPSEDTTAGAAAVHRMLTQAVDTLRHPRPSPVRPGERKSNINDDNDYREAVLEGAAKFILRQRLAGKDDDPAALDMHLCRIDPAQEMPDQADRTILAREATERANRIQDTDADWQTWCYLGI